MAVIFWHIHLPRDVHPVHWVSVEKELVGVMTYTKVVIKVAPSM